MSRGDGRIFLRGRRHWISYYAMVEGKSQEQREPGCEGCGGEDPRACKAAARLLKSRRTEIARDEYVPPKADKALVRSLLEAYRAGRELGGIKSADRFASHYRRVLAFFGHLRVRAVTTDMLEAWANARITEGYAKGTVQQWLALLRTALRRAWKRGQLAKLPIFPDLKIRNARQGYLVPTDFEAVARELILKPRRNGTPARDADLYADVARFFHETAWRPGEIFGLEWTTVDRQSGVIILPDSKNDEPRVVPIEGALVGIIERRWQARKVGDRLVQWVFHRRGERIGNFRKRWYAACARAGVGRRYFYDLRRSSARDQRGAGVPESVIMEKGGWKTRAVFERYNIVNVDDQREAARRTQLYRDAQLAKAPSVHRLADNRPAGHGQAGAGG